MLETAIGLACTLLGALARHYLSMRTWARIKEIAESILKNPDPSTTTDPEEAVTQAIVSENRRRISKVSGEIKLKLNGINDHGPDDTGSKS